MAKSWTIRRRGTQGWLYRPSESDRPKKSDRDDPGTRVAFRGTEGSISWGYHVAAALSSWRVAKDDKGEWMLTATAERVEPFYLRQSQPMLLFTAPREGLHPMCWPIREIGHHGSGIRAKLGPIEF